MSALIAYRNDADAATITATPQTGYPVANMQLRQLSERARFAVANNVINIDLGSVKPVRLVALLAVNALFVAGNTTKIEYSASSGGPWTTVPSPWPNEGAAGKSAARDVSPALYCVIPAAINARHWRITCGWARPGGAPYYEIGRLWISDALLLPGGVDGDWSLGATDAGKLDFSAGLQAFEDPRPRARVVSCSRSQLDALTAFGFADNAVNASDVPSLQALQQEAGATGEVILLPRIATALWMRRLGVYGHLAEIPTIRKLAGTNYAAEIRVIEER